MIHLLRRYLSLVIPGGLLILFALLSLLSDGYFGGADNISHYLISRYAFSYPHLFLSAWGRPLYTLVSAPFAQFGLQGAKMLNVILGISTAWLVFRIAQLLGIKPAPAAFILVCFTPLYFLMLPTALTEILFGFVIILAIFLFLKEDYLASAIVFSFLPFARTEGYILLPVFLAALLWARQFRAIPFLATGIVVFTIAGSFYYRDILWLIDLFPYPVNYTHPIYNKAGSLLHFLASRNETLGLPLEILFVAGVAAMVRDWFSSDRVILHRVHLLSVLVLGPFLLYLAFHSVLFWKAMGGSMGIERVLAGVMPLAALVALKGFGEVIALAGPNRYIRGFVIALFLVVIVIIPFKNNRIPYPLSPEEQTIREAAAWIKKSPYSGRLILYTDNNVPYYLGADPYRKNPASCYLFGDAKYLDTIPAGTVLIWDAHFGTNESKIPVDSLLGNLHQRVVRYFRPAEPWITFGGGLYDCYITVTTPPGIIYDNYAIRDSLSEAIDAGESLTVICTNNFENAGDVPGPAAWIADTVHRGKRALKMDGATEFSPGVCQPVSALQLKGDRPQLRVSLYLNNPARSAGSAHSAGSKTLLVISFEHNNKPYSYTSLNLNDTKGRAGKWDRIVLRAPVPSFFSPKDLLKVYIWNPDKQLFYVDDLKVDLIN